MAPPWATSQEQLFVLVTGANSGIGLGIAQRLIDEFLATRPASHHLGLVVTTRSSRKSQDTIASLVAYLKKQHSPIEAPRIHLSSVELDLCNLPSVYAAAERLTRAELVWSPMTEPAPIPRLDAVVFNAGIGGWTGLNWGALIGNMLTAGLLQATTYPTCKGAEAGLAVDPLTGQPATWADDDNTLGQVFCANVFGHYLFAHALLPLLGQSDNNSRIVWESSVEAGSWAHLDLDDLQGRRTDAAYESSKRLTDVLSLTFSRFSSLRSSESESKENSLRSSESSSGSPPHSPSSILTHPGVVCSTLFPLPWIVFYLYNLAMYISRWIGSPWHPVTAYKGACAAVWAVLEPTSSLDALDASHVKWGTSTTRNGDTYVKRTEVEGWGWTGQGDHELTAPLDDPKLPAILRNSVGRRTGTKVATAASRKEFVALGHDCWREMERLRAVWEPRVQKYREAEKNREEQRDREAQK